MKQREKLEKKEVEERKVWEGVKMEAEGKRKDQYLETMAIVLVKLQKKL